MYPVTVQRESLLCGGGGRQRSHAFIALLLQLKMGCEGCELWERVRRPQSGIGSRGGRQLCSRQRSYSCMYYIHVQHVQTVDLGALQAIPRMLCYFEVLDILA